MKTIGISLVMVWATLALCVDRGHAAEQFDMAEFLGFEVTDARSLNRDNPKTLFQTNSPYDDRIGISVDGVIVHQHGASAEHIGKILKSWSEKGFQTGRMFFADSDAGNHYTQGRFDGVEHFEDIELDRNGKRILCANVRPYMVPTPAWTEYLKTQVRYAIDGGATAIYPEEPLAHNFTGYEESFKKAFAKEYGIPWQGGHESCDAFFKTARLKNKLYIQLEQDLQRYTTQYAASRNRRVDFLVPIHSMFSNLSARLVAPLGTSLRIRGHKGYIGQIWTGPVRWTIGGCSNKNMTFFDSAYVNYDYFVNLVIDSDLKLYLLADPVEDDPSYKWDEYDKWYKECLAAKLMFPTINTYEIMPWPDRIFLPGYSIGGGTPGPDRYRTILMSAITALQDVPVGSRTDVAGGSAGIGMLIGDSAMWQNSQRPVQDAFMGPLMGLLKKGIPVSSVPIERSADRGYMKNFRLLMLSYEGWKPELAEYHDNLLAWLRDGGTLIVFDTKDDFDDVEMFWRHQGFATPQGHLLSKFGIAVDFAGDNVRQGAVSCYHKPFGRGHVVVSRLSPKTFVDDTAAESAYLPLVRMCFDKYVGEKLDEAGFLVARRGDLVIAHAFETSKVIEGTFLDIFSEELPVVYNPRMIPNTSLILYSISDKMSQTTPRVLWATYRLIGKKELGDETTVFITGPAQTSGRVKLYTAGRKLANLQALTPDGRVVSTSFAQDLDDTALIKFVYNPEGVGIKVTWDRQ